jgi:uncharacterized membrane protein
MRKALHISQAALIGGVYAAITIVFAPISYGVVQVRISEALTTLPYVFGPYAAVGLFLGCLFSNVYGGLGVYDIIGGSLITLLAGLTTAKLRKSKKPILAPLPPIILNSFLVSIYLHWIFAVPYWLTVISIGVGEFISCFVLGYPLLLCILKRYPNNKCQLDK